MDSITIGLTVGGVIFGTLVTYFVASYFFKKSINEKSLTPFIQFSSKLFSELDPELKENLLVSYKKHEIENLTQAQFVIANTGDIAIRDIIEPLRLVLPKDKNIFSVSLIHVEPKERNIAYNILDNDDQNIVEFKIPLLNSGEFFVFKILYQDSLIEESEAQDDEETSQEEDYFFKITADNLPPKLRIKELPYSYYEEESKRGYDWGGFWLALIFGVITASIIGVVYSFKDHAESLYLFSLGQFFNSETFTIYNLYVLVLIVVGVITLIISIFGIIIALSEITPDKEPKFKVPNKLRKERKYYPFDII